MPGASISNNIALVYRSSNEPRGVVAVMAENISLLYDALLCGIDPSQPVATKLCPLSGEFGFFPINFELVMRC